MFVNYAHRGASSYYPENTLISFRRGIEMGANGIETDLQRTRDGKIVLFHDDRIDKKSNGSGRIADYTYEELLTMDFGSWFNEGYEGTKIMLFEDFAREFLKLDLTFAIELKETGFEKDALAIIHKYQVHDQIYLSSFLYDALKNVHRLDASCKLSWLVADGITEENVKKLLEIGGSQICPRANQVTEKGIALAKSCGLGVRLWGVADENIMKKVYQMDIEGMTVNFPDKLRELLQFQYFDNNFVRMCFWADRVYRKKGNIK